MCDRHFCEQAYVRSNTQYHSKPSSSSLLRSASEKQKLLQNNDLDVIKVSSKTFTGNTEAMRYLSVGHEMRGMADDASQLAPGEDR